MSMGRCASMLNASTVAESVGSHRYIIFFVDFFWGFSLQMMALHVADYDLAIHHSEIVPVRSKWSQ